MTQNPSTHEEKVRSFWDRYVQSLHESGIQPPFDRWMVIRAEHDIAAYPDRKLAEQSPEDVDAYLAVLGRKPGLKDWQFRQAVDAIQNSKQDGVFTPSCTFLASNRRCSNRSTRGERPVRLGVYRVSSEFDVWRMPDPLRGRGLNFILFNILNRASPDGC